MAALAKPRRRLPHGLTDPERDVLACMADLFETADQVTISRSRVALILDARKVDRLHELMDIATSDDGREPAADDDACVTDDPHDEDTDREPNLGALSPGYISHLSRDDWGRIRVETCEPMRGQEDWATGGCDDGREIDVGDEAEDVGIGS